MINRRTSLALGLGGFAAASLPRPLLASDTSSGHMIEYEGVRAFGLPEQRLSIWLPPGYYQSGKSYRVVYMHDAQNLFDPALSNFNKVWAADRAMLSYAETNQTDPWIVVGIWSPGVDRYRQYLPLPAYQQASDSLRADMDEYAQGPVVSNHYINWLAQDLKPWVDRSFRTLRGRDDTALIGSSMGGLISLYGFLYHPNVFGRAGCVSTHWPAIAPQKVDSTDPELVSIWLGMLKDRLGQSNGRRLWFDHGTATLDAYYPPYQAAIDQHMETTDWARGSEWESCQYPGAEHEENAWAARLPEIFDWVLG